MKREGINRPKPPTIHDPDNHKWYLDYNRYFNEAEKYIDYLESAPTGVVDLLKSLDEDQLKELLRTCAIITDPLSQELMRKAVDSDKERTT